MRTPTMLTLTLLASAAALYAYVTHKIRAHYDVEDERRAFVCLAIGANIAFALLAAWLSYTMIPKAAPLLAKAGLYGVDISKVSNAPVPEALGVIVGAIYIVSMFLFIPFPFLHELLGGGGGGGGGGDGGGGGAGVLLQHDQTIDFLKFLAALLSICCMLLLGFADDVMDLRWRYKLILPTVASLPLLMVYLLSAGSTFVVVPLPLRTLLGVGVVNLSALYYVYMGSLAVFSTNSINILAGINGVEAGQSLIIAVSLLLNNAANLDHINYRNHLFSLYLLTPFVGAVTPLLYHNWYPSRVFVGDTFCYFAGMTFAVVGIAGHFSKTLLLFLVPQTLNFVYGCPQLFRLLPCPRHRLPSYSPHDDRMRPSTVTFTLESLSTPGRVVYRLLRVLCLVHATEVVTQATTGTDGVCDDDDVTDDDDRSSGGRRRSRRKSTRLSSAAVAARTSQQKKTDAQSCRTNSSRAMTSATTTTVTMNNLTIINVVLLACGPVREDTLCRYVLAFQCLCSTLAFVVRYQLAKLFYDVVH